MTPDTTIVYYTSNGDYPAMEEAVRKTILRNSDGLPIVSVSHRPVRDFGRNVCVGPIGRSKAHILMQLRIGAELAETPFVTVCEADMLYPPDFFQFSPPADDVYCYPREAYIVFTRAGKAGWFFRKRLYQLTGVVGREHLLGILDTLQELERDGVKTTLQRFLPTITKTDVFDAGPVVTMKTDRQMHAKSPHLPKGRGTSTLPIWGVARKLWEAYPCR